jgi:hypothetical protein
MHIKKGLNLISFDLKLFDLDYFREKFLLFCESKDTQYNITYYMYFLDPAGNLISENIVFDLAKENLERLIEYIYNNICSKHLMNSLNSSNIFYIHINSKYLNALDFKVYRLNSLSLCYII